MSISSLAGSAQELEESIAAALGGIRQGNLCLQIPGPHPDTVPQGSVSIPKLQHAVLISGVILEVRLVCTLRNKEQIRRSLYLWPFISIFKPNGQRLGLI